MSASGSGPRPFARPASCSVIGGGFSRLWYRTGPGAIVSGAVGEVDRRGPEFQGGTVNVVIPDGEGGWYVGGSFTQVGTEAGIERLAHIESDGAIDNG